MTFGDLREGSIVHLIHKGAAGVPAYKMGKVVSVGTAYADNNNTTNGMANMNNFGSMFNAANQQSFIDITVEVDGMNNVCKKLPISSSIQSSADVTIGTTTEMLNNEVRAAIMNSQNVLNSVESHKAKLAAYNDILAELNPQYAESKLDKEKIEHLESKVTSIESSLSEIKQLIINNNKQ